MNDNSSLPRTMAWHIVKKDWKLLWPLALVVATGHALLAVLRYQSATVDDLEPISAVVTFGLIIAMVLLIVRAVQEEAIPGVNQDWLARPIKRRDLLLAKVLLVALLIHGPIIASNVLLGLAEGFPFLQILRAALLGSIEIALVFSLPVTAIAALTRNLTEALSVSLVVALGLVVVYVALTRLFHVPNATDGTGVAWVWGALSHCLLLTATVAVLLLQYFRRSTFWSRVIFSGGLLVFLLTPRMPWQPAFAIQKSLSAYPDRGHQVTVAFDAPLGQEAANAKAAIGGELLIQHSDEKEEKTVRRNIVSILLPLRFSGLPAGLMLHVDHATLRLIDADGGVIYHGTGSVFDLPSTVGGQAALRRVLEIPAATYRRAADQVMRLEVEYSLTLLRPRPLPPLPALNAHRQLPDVGQCATSIDHEGTAVEVNCRTAGELPACISMHLEDATGRRNSDTYVCALNYEPAPLRFSEDPIDHLEAKLPFRPASGSQPYPIGELQLLDAQVVLRILDPQEHFSRHLVVPQFRLRDWQAPPAPPSSD
jgi:hypothetical protein